MDYFTVRLFKDFKFIGVSQYSNKCWGTLRLLDQALLFLSNYNQYLASREDEIPQEVLAHRFFAEENIECNRHKAQLAYMMDDSYNYMAKTALSEYNFPVFEIPDPDCGQIGFSSDDIRESVRIAKKLLTFDLRERVVHANIFEIFKKEDYCKMMGIDATTFDSSTFPNYHINPRNIPMNELEDFCEYAKEHEDGFMCEDSGEYIYLPIKSLQ